MWRNDELEYSVSEQGNRIVKLAIDSNLLPVITVDTYQTFNGDWCIEQLTESEAEHYELNREDIDVEVTDFIDMLRAYSEAALKAVQGQMNGDMVEFSDSVNSVYSPRYYNFETDSFNTDISVDLDQLVAWIKLEHGSVIPALEAYADMHFKSRSGFISFVTGALYDERRLGTLIWLGVHMYLADRLDWDQFYSDMTEMEYDIRTEHSTVTIDPNTFERMVNERITYELGTCPEADDIELDEWKAWRDRAVEAFGSDDLHLIVRPEIHEYEQFVNQVSAAWIESAPDRLAPAKNEAE